MNIVIFNIFFVLSIFIIYAINVIFYFFKSNTKFIEKNYSKKPRRLVK